MPTVKGILVGVGLFIGMVLLSEPCLRLFGVWLRYRGPRGGDFTAWEKPIVAVALFVGRYLIFMMPPLFLLCEVVGLILVWRASPQHAA